MLIQNLPKQSSSMDKDKRLPYSAPFLRIQEFTPSEYADVCRKPQLDYSDAFTKIYWDWNTNGYVDEDQHKEEYLYDAIPSPLYVNMDESKSEGFLNDDFEFVNYAQANQSFYSKHYNWSYQSKDKLAYVYAVRSTDRNDYFFGSKPSINHS